ncbi:MAG: hypothetical protein Q8Q85_11455 [Gemmatimonadales bacterium]|nr:hypothetical protein [Gemmatimonadales bacterium]
MPRSGNVDRTIRQSLQAFADKALEPSWRGREREAISHYAFGYLLPHFNGRLPFSHPAQIGIEVCVPGVPDHNVKGRVNKDLVIWGTRRIAATWNEEWLPTFAPRCILEWTYSRTGHGWRKAWEYDITWLRAFTEERRGCIGYAVALVVAAGSQQLLVARVALGRANLKWLVHSPRVA